MNTFKVGDRVELIEDYRAARASKGVQGTTTGRAYSGVDGDLVQVAYDNGNTVTTYTRRLKLVETKAHEYKAGDRVQITIPEGDDDCYGGHFFKTGTGKVEQLHSSASRLLVRGKASKDGNSWWVDAKYVTPIKVEKPKATLVTETDKPAVGDTIVAFWEANGVETRKKGVVARIDADGDYETAEGDCINYDGSQYTENAPHVYIVERAPKPEPVKELAHRTFLDAPVGSRATRSASTYIKTGKDEWSLVLSTGLVGPRSSEFFENCWPEAVLFTF